MDHGSSGAEEEASYLDALDYFEDSGVVELLCNLDFIASLGTPRERDAAPSSDLQHADSRPGKLDVPDTSLPEAAPPEAEPTPRSSSKTQEGPDDVYDQFDIGEVDLRLFRKIWGPKHILLRDKLAFLLGTTILWVSAYWLGSSPGTFWQLYTVGAVILLGSRIILYQRRRWHYYLLDFCYYANMFLLAHLWIFPRSHMLHKVTFGYNSGPLAWSILAFRNSLVFHDMDKVTSLYLHMMPFAVSWSMRWYRDAARFGPATEDPAWEAAGWRNLVAVPLSFYCLWAGAYYIKVFVISAATIEKRGYVTLFTYITSQKRGTFHSIARRIPRRLQPVVYLGLHLAFCATTLVLAALCWHSFLLHTALLIGIFSQAIWHGANFYFEVFAHRYAQQFKKTEGEAQATPLARETSGPPRTPAADRGSGAVGKKDS